MKEKLHYLGHSLFHPFDGFYEIRFRDKGSVGLGVFLLCLYGILACAEFQYTGFIVNENAVYEMNSVSIFISHIVIILLFAVSNWTVTSLFNGKGNMKSIFTVIAYSLVPLILTQVLNIVISNVIILDEVMLLRMVQGIGIVWFVFLIVSGLCTIHEYGLFQNLAALLATAISAILIIFLFVLFLTLEEKMFGFFTSVGKEFIRRM